MNHTPTTPSVALGKKKKTPRKSRSASRQHLSTPGKMKTNKNRSSSTPPPKSPQPQLQNPKASDLTIEELLGLSTAAADGLGRQDVIDQLMLHRDNVLTNASLRSDDPTYIRITNKIGYLGMYRHSQKDLQSQLGTFEAPADTYYGSWATDKGNIRNLRFLPEPFSEYDFSTFGGEIVQVLTNIPTKDDATAALGSNKSFKFNKGGIVKCRHYYPKDLQNQTELKNKIIHVIGRGFSNADDTTDPEFSFDDAEIAHSLLYNNDTTTHAMVIELVREGDIGRRKGNKMRHLVGAILFTDDVKIHKKEIRQGVESSRQVYQKNFRAFNMVQLTILPQYSNQRLGTVAMHAVEMALTALVNPADDKEPAADFLFWAGCASKFYKHLGFPTDPGPRTKTTSDGWLKMFECPFQLTTVDQFDRVEPMTDEENREIFFYKSFAYSDRDKFGELENWYLTDPVHRCITITYRSAMLKSYYYYNYGHNGSQNVGGKYVKTQEYIEEYPIVTTREVDGVTTIDIEITHYGIINNQDDCRCECIKHFLFVYGRRSQGGREYGFDVTIKMSAEIFNRHIKDYGYTSKGLTISLYGEFVGSNTTAALI